MSVRDGPASGLSSFCNLSYLILKTVPGGVFM